MRELLSLWKGASGGQGAELEELRKLRHDLRHYLCAAASVPQPPEGLILTENMLRMDDQLLSALVEQYRGQAESLGASVDIRLELRCGGDMRTDLCLILSNLLENAVEALQREGGGWLRARSISTEGYLSLVIGNSSRFPLHSFGGRYLSGKARGRFGVGLETVRQLAEQYGGEAVFFADGTQFCASVFLPKPASGSGGDKAKAAAENLSVMGRTNA